MPDTAVIFKGASKAMLAPTTYLKKVIGRLGTFYMPDREVLERMWVAWRRHHAVPWETAISRLVEPCPPGHQLASLFAELVNDTPALEASVMRHKQVIGKDWQQKTTAQVVPAIAFLYVLARLTQPEVVIETGCATGWTSALILAALKRNGRGHLHSIDIPPRKGELSMDWSLPEGLEPGFLVPEEFRQRWTLILGNARDELAPLLKTVGPIDMFYHDSDHTYQHMIWEYSSAYPFLRKGGHIVSDDIGWNLSFYDFACSMEEQTAICRNNLNFGAIRKRSGT